jgi:hypothetical protein
MNNARVQMGDQVEEIQSRETVRKSWIITKHKFTFNFN